MNRVCSCEHNTEGEDCERCKPLFNNKPWAFATSQNANECEECDCNGKASECVYDADLGHGRCLNCRDNTSGPKCDQCAKNHFRDANGNCVECDCHIDGSESPQCDSNGKCSCRTGIEGDKCDACMDNYYELTRAGCQPCNCNIDGSLNDTPSCDPVDGKCVCKGNVQGRRCDVCQNGFMGVISDGEIERPDPNNEFGCTPCFCYEHSNICHASDDFVKAQVASTFGESSEDWKTIGGSGVEYDSLQGRISSDDGFVAPDVYQGEHRFSYNQKIRFDLTLKDEIGAVDNADISIKGLDKTGKPVKVSAIISPHPSTKTQTYSIPLHQTYFKPEVGFLDSNQFMEILSDLMQIHVQSGPAILDNFVLESARPRNYDGDEATEKANWVETCEEPRYEGRSLESCAKGFTRDTKSKNKVKALYVDCVECGCNNHARLPCDPETGVCQCEQNTMGDHCERCMDGFFGTATDGQYFLRYNWKL